MLRLRGAWRIENVAQIEAALHAIDAGRGCDRIVIDSSGVDALDLSGAWLLKRWVEHVQADGARVELTGSVAEHFDFIGDIVERGPTSEPIEPPARGTVRD